MDGRKREKIDRWIDLSELPRDCRGFIKWKDSIGYDVKFKYDKHIGILTILDYNINDQKVLIYIDGCTNKNGKTIATAHLQECKLGNFLKRPIAKTHPELIKYFYDKNDAYKYTHGSNKKVEMICPDCGTKKFQSPNELTRQGFSCCACSDGVSYPNKFIYHMLTQIGVKFKNEITKLDPGFEWVCDYHYDFYIEKNNQKFFIEADGAFHRYADVKKRDDAKNRLAKEHGIDIIRIDCNYDTIENRCNFIKNNILNSKLSQIINLTNVDWDLCDRQSISSLVVMACKYWNEGIKSTTKIAKLMPVSSKTVREYLKVGASLGICDYTPSKGKNIDRSLAIQEAKKCTTKRVALYFNNNLIGVFYSGAELERQSICIIGKKLSQAVISQICCGKRQATRDGYTMKHISDEEYQQLKLTIQNECNTLKEAI